MRVWKKTPIFWWAALAGLLILVACGGGEAPTETAEETTAPPEEAQPVSTQISADRWEGGGLTITARRDAPTFPGASLALPGVEEGAVLEAGNVPFAFEVADYTLGDQTSDAGTNGLANSAKGQHIHLILNNDPYSAHYEASFEKEMEEGHYIALAFLSRSYHESLKNPEAVVLTQFFVGEEGGEDEADLTAPHLFYSRPKGTYKGADTEKLMLDFYSANVDLSADGNKVRATILGNEFIFTEWIPYVIEGLPLGEIEIQLELIDAEGNVVPGPFNTVTRTVTLEPADEAAES